MSSPPHPTAMKQIAPDQRGVQDLSDLCTRANSETVAVAVKLECTGQIRKNGEKKVVKSASEMSVLAG